MRALASAVGMNNGNLSKLENGKSGYSEEMLKKIADVLNVSIGVLFSEHEALETALLNMREVPVLSAQQLGTWRDPDTFEYDERQRYFHTEMSVVSTFGFGWIVEDDANEPRFSAGDALIFDVKKQPVMGTVIIAQDADGFVFIGQCRVLGAGTGQFAVVPRNRTYPVISSSDRTDLQVRGTLVERREYFK